MAQTKGQCMQLNTAVIYFHERNKDILIRVSISRKESVSLLCFQMQHVNTVGSQTLQKGTQNVERLLSSGLPLCPLNPCRHRDSMRVPPARTGSRVQAIY
jgi:hypothetical protein